LLLQRLFGVLQLELDIWPARFTSKFPTAVGVAASYARVVVEGSAPHEIRPANGGVLAFMIAGKMIFAPIVHHPGTKPNPFMQNALEEAQSKVDSTFAELWLELVGG
jgi:hypothetical protein